MSIFNIFKKKIDRESLESYIAENYSPVPQARFGLFRKADVPAESDDMLFFKPDDSAYYAEYGEMVPEEKPKTVKLESTAPSGWFKRSDVDAVRNISAADLDISFGEAINNWLAKKAMTTSRFYKKANLNSAWLGNVVNNNVRPKKHMALACCIGLGLNLEESEDLLKKAGYSFSNSDMEDVIVKWFVENGIYDIDSVNEILYEKDLLPLGQKM